MKKYRVQIIEVDEPEHGCESKKSFRETIESAAASARDGVVRFGAWCKEHRDELAAGAAVLTGGLAIAKKFTNAGRTVTEQERYRIEHRYYDPSTGLYWPLRRPLTGREVQELDMRRRRGEPVGDVLSEFGVLKK